MSLKNKTAVVTGGGSGLGRACAIQLARDGAAVAVWDLNASGAAETVRMIEAEGNRAAAYVGDAAAKADIDNILVRIRAELGPALILVNNAGITGFSPFLKITEEALQRIYRINLMGPFMLTQSVMPDMLTAAWGRIIFHLFLVSPNRSHQQGPLLLLEGGHHRADEVAGPGIRRLRHHGKQYSSGLH
jgi:2-hydroxycyclohexanecarboxyl-CoA dehydrogenase